MPVVVTGTLLGAYAAYGMGVLRNDAHSLGLFFILESLNCLIGSQLLITTIFLTINQVRACAAIIERPLIENLHLCSLWDCIAAKVWSSMMFRPRRAFILVLVMPQSLGFGQYQDDCCVAAGCSILPCCRLHCLVHPLVWSVHSQERVQSVANGLAVLSVLHQVTEVWF